MEDDILALEAAELEEFIEKYMKLDRRVQRPTDLFSILPGSREGKYQYALKYFLDPQKPHGFRYTLLEPFLDHIGFHEFNLSGQHIEIDDEVRIADEGSDGRIDLVICGGNALADHPRWAVFIELKVGAGEGEQQTATYADADAWNYSWFDSDEVSIDRLDDKKYVYVKRNIADGPDDDTFEAVDWKHLVKRFEREVQDAVFDYPNRSVIQFTDFIQSLKETESMDSSTDADELNERLKLYFDYQDLIHQVERANSQFESDFEDISTYLTENWEPKLLDKYDFEDSRWITSPSSSSKWQGILPEYWDQDPLDRSSTIRLYFRHSPTTDILRDGIMTFRLRLPPQRSVHTEEIYGDQSFNDVFTEICTSEYEAKIERELEPLDVDKVRLGSASALVTKNYQLDPQNVAGSYFDHLETAVGEFCGDQTDFVPLMNEIFEETYRTVFDKEPAGKPPEPLRKQ